MVVVRGRDWLGPLALLLAGCFESNTPQHGVPLASFCDRFFDALCEPLESCACGPSMLRGCREDEALLCAGFPSEALVSASEEGLVRYDEEAAATLLDRMLHRTDPCASFVASLEWRTRDLFSLGGVFDGTLPAGSPCELLGFELITACADGTCGGSGSERVCIEAVGPGETCDALHACVDLDADLLEFRGVDLLTLECDGVCRSRAGVGEACARSIDCARGGCDAKRCRVFENGEPCTRANDCGSFYCDETRRCAPGDAPLGDTCADPTACESDLCWDGACAPAYCGTF
jgi:hypothetical protein